MVVILSIINACTNKIINLNMVRMVRWAQFAWPACIPNLRVGDRLAWLHGGQADNGVHDDQFPALITAVCSHQQ